DSGTLTMGQPGITDTAAGVPETGGAASGGDLESATADPATGVMRATLPFSLPAARGKAQPKLALQYSSASGMGVAGWGGTLNLPTIERKNASGPPKYRDPAYGQAIDPSDPADPTKSGEDQFVYGGEELIPICLVQGRECPGAEPEIMPSFASSGGWHYYRL